jgi:hypothetical protein
MCLAKLPQVRIREDIEVHCKPNEKNLAELGVCAIVEMNRTDAYTKRLVSGQK